MTMGQQKDRQGDLMVGWAEMPRSPGHVFYDRLPSVLIEGGFDGFAEAASVLLRGQAGGAFGAAGALMHLVGLLIDSERGLEWRCSDSLSYGSFYGWKAGIVCRTIPGCHGPARACPMRSTRRSSTGF